MTKKQEWSIAVSWGYVVDVYKRVHKSLNPPKTCQNIFVMVP
jgi:hypothetical protein